MIGHNPRVMKLAITLAVGLLVGSALGWFVGYIHPNSKATRRAAWCMDRAEPEFSSAAIYALATIPLIIAGNTNTAIERLSGPIASYYRFYASSPGTNEYRMRMRKVIDEMARTNVIVATRIQRETQRNGWEDVWIDGLGYVSVKTSHNTSSSAKDGRDSSVNISHPIRSETNQASSSTGSRR